MEVKTTKRSEQKWEDIFTDIPKKQWLDAELTEQGLTIMGKVYKPEDFPFFLQAMEEFIKKIKEDLEIK